jgi:hypothetical protein
MTKFKVYRIAGSGLVQIEIVEAYDWMSLISMFQYNGNPIFKIEVYSSSYPVKGE